ncbi:GNAT family N-acetyltransferase [Leeia aquatica]|uniref:GNAT family N-acetyltransferase n=1 Tax=Leeia aquatica TaxID=2725557 RepID=A0A847S7V3_9NEIS|nr:GNAT family protein [Leeia aquatica]NLR74945.1 GNAT family N-acetyltransferase [Leeia aquatica]
MSRDPVINPFGQAIGYPVANWQALTGPEHMVMTGRYCRLEPLSRAHFDGLWQCLMSDEAQDTWTYLMDHPASRAEFDAWLNKRVDSTDPLFFAILDQQTGAVLGQASYLRIDRKEGAVEVGWLHYSPTLQRSRIATEAMYLMMKQAFAWGYRRYEWKCNSLNAPSCRAAVRLGFTFEGIHRQVRVDRGHNRDTAWYSILDHEWPRISVELGRWLSPDNFAPDGQQRSRLDLSAA